MWDFNGEDDATRVRSQGARFGRHFNENLIRFVQGGGGRIPPCQPAGRILHVQSSELGKRRFFSPIRFVFPLLNIQSDDFNAGTAPGC